MKRAFAMTALLVGLIAVPVAAAQDPPAKNDRRGRAAPGMGGMAEMGMPGALQRRSPGPEEKQIVRIFALQHINARSCASSIQEAGLGLRVAGDDASNSLIVSGSESAMEPVEQLIAALDVPGAGGGTVETGFFKTPTPVTRNLLNLVHTIVSKRTEVAGHDFLLVVKGPQAELEQVKTLLAEYAATCADKESGPETEPKPSLQLTFFLLQAVGDPDSLSEGVQPLPDLLQPVARALQEVGVSHAGLLATLVVSVESESEFEVQGLIDQAGSKISAMIKGEAECDEGAKGPARLRVSARLQTVDRKGPPLTLFDVNTTVSAPQGDFVVLAVSPLETATNSVALVVRITPAGGTVGRKK